MKKFYELLDTRYSLPVSIKIAPFGGTTPHVDVEIKGKRLHRGRLTTEIDVNHNIYTTDMIDLKITIAGKDYNKENESAALFKTMIIDDVDVTSYVTRNAIYKTDMPWGVYDRPTDHLGWNGVWSFISQKPFFHIKHEIKNYGWLLMPELSKN
jgi:hypothetical protein